jgi:hypothetical protein
MRELRYESFLGEANDEVVGRRLSEVKDIMDQI